MDEDKRHSCKEPRRAPITGGLPRSSPTSRDPRVVTLFFPPSFFLSFFSLFLSFLSSCERFAATHAAHRYAFRSLDRSNKAFKVIVWCRFTLI